jgi:hypothetical protein
MGSYGEAVSYSEHVIILFRIARRQALDAKIEAARRYMEMDYDHESEELLTEVIDYTATHLDDAALLSSMASLHDSAKCLRSFLRKRHAPPTQIGISEDIDGPSPFAHQSPIVGPSLMPPMSDPVSQEREGPQPETNLPQAMTIEDGAPDPEGDFPSHTNSGSVPLPQSDGPGSVRDFTPMSPFNQRSTFGRRPNPWSRFM